MHRIEHIRFFLSFFGYLRNNSASLQGDESQGWSNGKTERPRAVGTTLKGMEPKFAVSKIASRHFTMKTTQSCPFSLQNPDFPRENLVVTVSLEGDISIFIEIVSYEFERRKN
jgi:hypothetical protein